jgi:transposase
LEVRDELVRRTYAPLPARRQEIPKDGAGETSADAAAICEAVRRPTIRFVRIKTAEQQGQLMQHRTRDLLMRHAPSLINALRAHLAELGIVAAQGDKGLEELLSIVADDRDERLPVDGRTSAIVLAAQIQALQKLIGSLEKRIKIQHRNNAVSQRLETIPGKQGDRYARLAEMLEGLFGLKISEGAIANMRAQVPKTELTIRRD